jgi:hypothetical protein
MKMKSGFSMKGQAAVLDKKKKETFGLRHHPLTAENQKLQFPKSNQTGRGGNLADN